VPLLTRSDQVGSYATGLYGRGEAEHATALLDAWWAKHGEKIPSVQFYSARFHTACYGTGDWSKALETYRCMQKLAAAGVISDKEDLYRLVVDNFNKNVGYPEDEIKRRAALLNQERVEAQKALGKDP
jgi:hypothetical protein